MVLSVLGSFILARVTRQFVARSKLFSNGNCPFDWNSNPMLSANPLIQKHIQSETDIYLFMTRHEVQSMDTHSAERKYEL